MQPINAINYRGYDINVHIDDDPQDPSHDDDGWLGTFSHWHRRYTFAHCAERLANMPEDFEDLIRRHNKHDIVMIPVAMLDHSGVHLWEGTSHHDCDSGGWDSGPVGGYWTDRKRIADLLCIKKLTKTTIEKVKEQLRMELKVLDAWVSGECYGFTVTTGEGEDTDMSCWGFIGDDKYMISEAKSEIDAYIKNKEKEA